MSLARTLRMQHQASTDARSAPWSPTTDGSLTNMLLSTQLPFGVTHNMVEWFIVAGERAGLRLLVDAQRSVPWPAELLTKTQGNQRDRDESGVQFLARERGVNLFRTTMVPKQPPAGLARSLWGKIRELGRSSVTKEKKNRYKTTPRLFGTSHLFTSLEQLVTLLGPRDPLAPSLIYPGASQMWHVHTLLERGDERVCLRAITITMPQEPTSTATTPQPRDYLVVEYRNKFQLPSHGRKVASSPEAVQGSVYASGVVAIESESAPGRLELYGVLEMDLKGKITVQENTEAACRLVQSMLSEITTAVENRAIETLAWDTAQVYDVVRRSSVHHHRGDACSTCGQFADQGDRLVMCRKCYAVVCSDCRSGYRFGRQEVQLCIACWHLAKDVIIK